MGIFCSFRWLGVSCYKELNNKSYKLAEIDKQERIVTYNRVGCIYLGGVPKRHTVALVVLIWELKHPVTIDDALRAHFYPTFISRCVASLCAWRNMQFNAFGIIFRLI